MIFLSPGSFRASMVPLIGDAQYRLFHMGIRPIGADVGGDDPYVAFARSLWHGPKDRIVRRREEAQARREQQERWNRQLQRHLELDQLLMAKAFGYAHIVSYPPGKDWAKEFAQFGDLRPQPPRPTCGQCGWTLTTSGFCSCCDSGERGWP